MLTLCVHRQLAEFTLEIDVTCAYPVTAIFGPSGLRQNHPLKSHKRPHAAR